MEGNKALIEKFYTAFQQLDYNTMRTCYADDIVFNDPAFGILQGEVVNKMWEMLCKKATNFSITFNNIQLLDEAYATCNWQAKYTFSKTGRPVVNKIKAHMRIQNGFITEHTDQFDLYKWSRQALGLSGVLLGWSNYMKTKIHNNAIAGLNKFMYQQ
jgi:ketosteroid isomerase-like protein